MESYDEIKCVQQPPTFKQSLYNHQLAAIYKLEQHEKRKKIDCWDDDYIETNSRR